MHIFWAVTGFYEETLASWNICLMIFNFIYLFLFLWIFTKIHFCSHIFITLLEHICSFYVFNWIFVFAWHCGFIREEREVHVKHMGMGSSCTGYTGFFHREREQNPLAGKAADVHISFSINAHTNTHNTEVKQHFEEVKVHIFPSLFFSPPTANEEATSPCDLNLTLLSMHPVLMTVSKRTLHLVFFHSHAIIWQ